MLWQSVLKAETNIREAVSDIETNFILVAGPSGHAVWGAYILDHTNSAIVVSNPAPGVVAYPRFFCLCCPVLRWGDTPPEESCQSVEKSEEQARGPNPWNVQYSYVGNATELVCGRYPVRFRLGYWLFWLWVLWFHLRLVPWLGLYGLYLHLPTYVDGVLLS
jgi:hypothetical protein